MSEATEESELEGECAQAWRATQGFVTGEGGRGAAERERKMRQHFESCGPCRDRYRGAVMTLAHIGRSRRRERGERERAERRQGLRRMARQFGMPRATSWFRTRTLLYPVLGILLVILVGRRPAAAAHLCWVSGVVVAEKLPLDAADSKAAVGSGDWCRTGPQSRARLVTKTLSANLEELTWVALERARPTRLRMEGGAVHLVGSGMLITPKGLVELTSARARVDLTQGLQVSCEAGSVRVSRAAGEHSLHAGERLSIGEVGPAQSEG